MLLANGTAKARRGQEAPLATCRTYTISKRRAQSLWVLRIIEEPTPLQAEILSVFGYKIKGGVLQKIFR